MQKKILFVVAAAILMGGCGYYSQYDNLEHAKKLRVGMTKKEVLEVMGEPLTNEAYNTPNVWYYYVDTKWHDGLSTEDECMPLIFENDKLTGFGNDFYNQLRMQNKHVIKD